MTTRSYAFTINNWSEEDWETIINLDNYRYFIFGIEQGDLGTWHLQCYIYYKTSVRFSSIKKLFPTAHIESAKGNPKQNQEYCSKEGNFLEFGELPTQGKAQFDQVQLAMDNPEENWGNYRQNFKAFNEYKLKMQKTLPKCKPEVIITDFFWQVVPFIENEAYIVNTWDNGIFDLYRGEQVVVLDLEFHTLSGPDLKTIENWLIYGLTPKYKDGYQVGRVTATRIFICSTDKYRHLSNIKINILYKIINEDGVLQEKEEDNQEEEDI